MRYLITYIEDNRTKCFYTFYFEPENHFKIGMVVFDLLKKQFTTDGVNWIDIEIDHL